MELYFALCCLFVVVHGAIHNPRNLPQLYQPESIKFLDEKTLVDSKNLRDRIKVEKCSYLDGQFLCKDKTRCIDLVDTCNGNCDCGDCSDETDQCWVYDETLCRTCPQCLTTPDGPQCLCGENDYKFIRVCKEIEECGTDNVCDQKCIRYEGVERCSCVDNYRGKFESAGRSCKSNVVYENVLLYSTSDSIKMYNFTAKQTVVIKDNIKCKGLAAAQNDIYYGAAHEKTGYVYKMSILNGETEVDNAFETYSSMIFSIDIDWITGNVYFSTDKVLAACSKTGYLCARIKHLKITDSCHIALAPRSGLLFHSIRSLYHFYEDSKIMKSSMDGSDETVLVSSGLRHPMALTVDESSQKVYWMDCDLGDVESIQFNGNNRKALYSNSLTHIFTISTFERNIFWTEEGKNAIVTNFDTDSKSISDRNTTTVKYLYAYNPVLQRIQTDKISNPCADEPCDKGLCLLRPSVSDGLNFTCLCDQYIYSTTQRWCNVPAENDDWQFETASEYKIQPRQPKSKRKTNWFNVALVIVLIGVVAFAIYRRKTLFRYYDRIFNWNWNREDQIHLNDYEQLLNE